MKTYTVLLTNSLAVPLLQNDELVVRCSHCKQFFSHEQFDSHECKLPLINGAKEIAVTYVREDNHGEMKTIVGRGIDGILYALIVEPRKPIPVVSSIRRNFTERKPDEDFTEPETRLYLVGIKCLKCGKPET